MTNNFHQEDPTLRGDGDGTTRAVDIGDYDSADPIIFTDYGQYVVYNRDTTPELWAPKIPRAGAAGTTLPYTVDSATYPNPASDPNLTFYGGADVAYADAQIDDQLNKAQEELTGENYVIFPEDVDTLVAVNDTIPAASKIALRTSRGLMIVAEGSAGGTLTVLNDYTATIGGNAVNLCHIEWGVHDARGWGAVSGGGDATTNLQRFFDYITGLSIDKYAFLIGDFSVTKVTWSGAGNKLICAGSVTGIDTNAQDCVFEFKNMVDSHVQGRLVVSAGYRQNYASAIKLWGEQANGATSLVQMDMVSAVAALKAWTIGDITEADTRLSEIVIAGGYTFGCPTIVEAIGTQVVVDFKGYQNNIVQGSWDNGDWTGFSKFNVDTKGARVNIVGGEVLKTADTDGAGFRLKAISSPSFDDNYGSVICTGVEIEVASALAFTTNDGVVTPLNGELTFVSCGGVHTQDSQALIQCDALFNGLLRAKACNFKATVPRTNLTILAPGAPIIDIDYMSFGKNYPTGLQGYSGGILRFDKRQILNAQSVGGQSFTQDVKTIVVYGTENPTEDTTRFAGDYDHTTGIFTVPTGGLKSVEVYASIKASATTQSDLEVYVGGAFYAQLCPTYAGFTFSTGWLMGKADLGDLAAGTTIDIRYTQRSANSTELGGSDSHFIISARN